MLSQYPYLIITNQLGLNGVAIHDLSQNLSPDGESPHSTNVPINELELVDFPRNLDGVISNLSIIFPTEREVEECIKL